MKKSYTRNFCLSLLFATIFVNKSVDSVRHSDHEENGIERDLLHSLKKYGGSNPLDVQNALENEDNLFRRLLELEAKYTRGQKRTTNDVFDVQDEFLDDLLMQSQLKPDLEVIPPWVVFLLSNKQKEKNNRVLTPRLGRDIEDDTDCQRSRPPFAPRLGKKSLPFKPRLGRQVYEDVKC